MNYLQNWLAILAITLSGFAQADTVRLQLGGLDNNSLDAWLTLSGTNIVSGSSKLYFADADSMSFQADYGQGLVDFDVQGVSNLIPSYLGIDSSGSYSLYSMRISLTESVTNPGIDTPWSFSQGQDAVSGIEDDYYARLTNLSTGSIYGQSRIAGAYWTEVATVPLPAAVWLFGLALGCLGWLQRKQAV